MSKIIFLILVVGFFVACKKESSIVTAVIPSNMTFQLNSMDQVCFTKDSGSLIAGVYHHKYTFIKTNAAFDIEWTKNNFAWGNLIYGSGWGSYSYSIQIVKYFNETTGAMFVLDLSWRVGMSCILQL